MKNIILLIMISFIYLVASGQNASDMVLKNEFIMMEAGSKPSVLEAQAEIVIDFNNRASQNEKLAVQQITIQRMYAPANNIMPTVELVIEVILKKANKDVNQPPSAEITLEPQTKPSELKAIAIKAE